MIRPLFSIHPCQLYFNHHQIYFNFQVYFNNHHHQVYFAERESQIVLGDLGAVNCTGWVEGFTKLNLSAFSMIVPPDYSRRNWRENVNNPCYRWTFIEAFW